MPRSSINPSAHGRRPTISPRGRVGVGVAAALLAVTACAPPPTIDGDTSPAPIGAEAEARKKKTTTTTTTTTTTPTTTTSTTTAPTTTTTAPTTTTTTTTAPTTTTTTTTTTTAPTSIPVGSDALQRKALSQLRQFTGWLGGQRGYVGEVGWPNTSDTRWNALGDIWYREANRSSLWVTAWATGEWWGPYVLAVYGNSGSSLGTALRPAAVVEAHRGAPGHDRGINVNGGEFGIGANLGTGTGATFSNVNRGTFGSTYHYDGQTSFNYLASRGVEVVRLPFRWERIQPTPGGALDTAELGRIRAAIDRAGAAGMSVLPTVMNYGAYWLHDSATNTGRRTPIGSASITQAHFADLWRRLAIGLGDRPNIAAWGLMNEPVAMPGEAPTWERASQAAVDAIRSAGDRKVIAVPGYNWSTASRFPATHPNGPWVNDPARNLVYEAHHYFDRTNAGEYGTYDWELAEAVKQGF
jgi:hypothetical protein